MNSQHACCPTCMIKAGDSVTEKTTWKSSLLGGGELYALSHVKDFICGGLLRSTANVAVQPPCWQGHELTVTADGVFRGKGRQAETLSCTHTHLQPHTRAFHTHLLFYNHSFKRCIFLLTHTLAYSRCRSQRSTWGVTVEKEGHWEMCLATCRASILRAASTSSSWAAHM